MLSSFLVYTSTGQTQGTVGGSLNAASGSNGSLPGTHTVSFDVRLGEWTDLLLLYDLMAEARYRLADLGGVGHAEAWFEQSFFWNGILQILDATHAPISFTLTSESGVDWTQPVPEPGSLASGVVGIALLRGLHSVAARRRRRPAIA
jgi:hypothetical protein